MKKICKICKKEINYPSVKVSSPEEEKGYYCQKCWDKILKKKLI